MVSVTSSWRVPKSGVRSRAGANIVCLDSELRSLYSSLSKCSANNRAFLYVVGDAKLREEIARVYVRTLETRHLYILKQAILVACRQPGGCWRIPIHRSRRCLKRLREENPPTPINTVKIVRHLSALRPVPKLRLLSSHLNTTFQPLFRRGLNSLREPLSM